MAFQAVASFLVSSVIGVETIVALGITASGLAAITSVVAFGLAYATSRIIAGSSSGRSGGNTDQGVRIQLPPATYNKVPVIYGRAFQQGILTDARISADSNNTMTYVLTLSEATSTGTFRLNDIYWNDERMLFGPDGYTVTATEKIQTISVDGVTTSTTVIETKYNGLIKCFTYARGGGIGSSSTQIFPELNHAFVDPHRVDAYKLFDICNVTSTASWQMNDLAFGIIQLTDDTNHTVAQLQTITYDIYNTLSNPGLVWYDYMTNARYGAGFTATSVNTTTSISDSPTSLKTISNQNPANQFNAAGQPIFQYRYEINGVINTGETVLTNLQKINMASASWTTYDHKLGEWRVVPNRATTSTDIIFAFSDDNIIGDISVTGTNLEDLYNQLEVAFPNNLLRDQIDYYRDNIAEVDQNPGEFPNQLTMRTDLCNNNIHAGRVGLMELYQSRADKVVTLTADYSALQVEVGDVISLTNSIYGFVNKLFRVSRVRETEADDGGLAAEITGIEYDPAVYVDYSLYLSAQQPTSGIPNDNTPATPGQPYVFSENREGDPPYFIPSFTVRVNIPGNQYAYTGMKLYISTNDSVFDFLTNMNSPNWNPGSSGSYATAGIGGLQAGTYYFLAIAERGGQDSRPGPHSAPFTWDPIFPSQNIDFNQGPI
jgi:hypothetical protein